VVVLANYVLEIQADALLGMTKFVADTTMAVAATFTDIRVDRTSVDEQAGLIQIYFSRGVSGEEAMQPQAIPAVVWAFCVAIVAALVAIGVITWSVKEIVRKGGLPFLTIGATAVLVGAVGFLAWSLLRRR